MEPYEATKIVFQRIKSLDSENASKIMGILLIQDHGEKEMIRLAFGPESLLHSAIVKARMELGLVSVTTSSSSSSSSTTSPSSLSPFNNSLSLPRQNSLSATSSRLLGGVNLPSPLSIPNLSSNSVPSSWSSSSFVDFAVSDDLTNAYTGISSSSSSTMSAAASPFYVNGEFDLADELQLQDRLSFLNDVSPPIGAKTNDLFCQDLASSPRTGTDPVFFPSYYSNWNGAGPLHRRSLSVSDICMGSDDLSAGLDWKPCLYFARGYCKNGAGCHFLHSGDGGDATMVDPCQDLLRSKSTQQQRFAAASPRLMSANSSYPPFLPNKYINFLPQQPFPADYRSNRERLERGDCHGMSSPGSRQIYLTFPADSTFKEEDVSSYFSIFGPVQDVRIPYQQKRMFGFVTFEFSETVKLILAKGNPHFVCDARVLVKPYKEKGKIAEKHRKPQIERGDYTGCGNSPTGLETRDLYDLQHGARILYNSPDLLWRMKLEEQADLQQAIELQNRRLMGLHLLDVKRNTISAATVVSSPKYPFSDIPPTDPNTIEAKEGQELNPVDEAVNELEKDKKAATEKENPPMHQSLDHNLPDSPFASPKAANANSTAFTDDTSEVDRSCHKPLFPPTSSHDIAPFKSCYFQFPKFASGHETIGI